MAPYFEAFALSLLSPYVGDRFPWFFRVIVKQPSQRPLRCPEQAYLSASEGIDTQGKGMYTLLLDIVEHTCPLSTPTTTSSLYSDCTPSLQAAFTRLRINPFCFSCTLPNAMASIIHSASEHRSFIFLNPRI